MKKISYILSLSLLINIIHNSMPMIQERKESTCIAKTILNLEFNHENSMPYCHAFTVLNPPRELMRHFSEKTKQYGALVSYALSENKDVTDADFIQAEENLYNSYVKQRHDTLEAFKKKLYTIAEENTQLETLNTALEKHLNFFKFGNDKAFNPLLVIYIKDTLTIYSIDQLRKSSLLYKLKKHLSDHHQKLYGFVDDYNKK